MRADPEIVNVSGAPGIYYKESIPGLPKRLQIRTQNLMRDQNLARMRHFFISHAAYLLV